MTNSRHSEDWKGPSSRANRMDRKHSRSTKLMVTAEQIEGLQEGDLARWLRIKELRKWAAKHKAG